MIYSLYLPSPCFYEISFYIGTLLYMHIYALLQKHSNYGCVCEMFVASYSVTYCIFIPGKPGLGFYYYCAVYDRVQIVGYVLACRSYSFVCMFAHYTISLSSLCKLLWRHWTYKMFVRYSLPSAQVRLSMFSQLYIIQYMGLCVFSLPISLVMIEKIDILCVIIIIKSEVWTIIHF